MSRFSVAQEPELTSADYGSGFPGDPQSEASVGEALDRARLVRAFRGRARFLTGAVVLGVALGIVVFVFWPRTYKATAVLSYEGESPDANRELGVAAQAMFLQSVMESTRRALNEDAPIHDAFHVETAPPGLHLEATGRTPGAAAARANALVTFFLQEETERVAERTATALVAAQADEVAARQSLSQVQQELQSFREKSEVADLSVERQRAIEEAAELRFEAIHEEISAQSEQARFEALQQAARELPRLVVAHREDPAAAATLEQTQAELREARATLSDEHPRVQALQARVEDLEQAPRATQRTARPNPVRQQVRRSRAQAAQRAASANDRAASLQDLAERAAVRARELSELEGQVSILVTRVEIAKEAHEQAVRRVSELQDVSPRPDFVSTGPARGSSLPIDESARWVIPSLLPLALLLIVGLLVVASDYRRLRMITAREVAWWGRGPVIGVSGWPNDAQGLDDLVAELEDVASGKLGRTLVVPATEDERALACAFAARLAEAPWFSAGILDVEEEDASGPVDEVPGASSIAAPPRVSSLPPPAPETEQEPHAVPDEPTDAGRRVRRATLRMILSGPHSGSEHADVEAAFQSIELGANMQMDRDSMVVTAPAYIVGVPSQAPPATVVVANTVQVEGRPHVNAPSALLQRAARRLFEGLEENDYRSRPPPGSGPEQRGIGIAWNGPLRGPSLRRAARLSDRVVVVVRGGARSGLELRGVKARIGRMDNVGFLVVDVPADLAEVDRVGDVKSFWQPTTKRPSSVRAPATDVA